VKKVIISRQFGVWDISLRCRCLTNRQSKDLIRMRENLVAYANTHFDYEKEYMKLIHDSEFAILTMKKSIEKKYAVIFSLLITIVILLCWCANALLLSRYFISRKQTSLKNVYLQMDAYAGKYGIDSQELINILDSSSSTYNCDVMILGQDMSIITSNVADADALTERLIGYFFDKNLGDSQRILEKEDSYTMQINTDYKNRAEYIELWGVTSTGNPIIIRSAVSGINTNARLANILLAYIGLIAISLSYFIVKFISKSITQPILKMVDISDKMAKLDFNVKYEGDECNEIGVLGKHINQLSDTLEKTISELKTANAELESELKKRTEIDDMRKEFLSNVSHELKTPIALIQGYAEGLSCCVNDDEESKNFYCEVITDEANKMNKLVRNLLDLNELEFGQNNVNIERFNITELIKNCISASDILIKQDNIKVEFDSGKDYYVWSDEFKIEQVVNNYLSNAIHYANGEEKIIRVDIDTNDDKLRVRVFNSGDNIPDTELDKLWTKFYKVDKARTREYGGSGVGLSIVKATMDTLNQKYGVINCDGGVEFYFEVDTK